VTDPVSVYGVLEQAAAAHGGVDLMVNAASAYGGDRAGPFGGGGVKEVTAVPRHKIVGVVSTSDKSAADA
jgi:hypothetical protein